MLEHGEVSLQQIADPVLTSDAAGAQVTLNPPAVEAFGVPEGGGDPWATWEVRALDGGPPLSLGELPLARVLRGELIRDLELDARPPGGPTRTYRINGELLGGNGGGP